jgi:YidC/Oxa1 family membrane protein insertase
MYQSQFGPDPAARPVFEQPEVSPASELEQPVALPVVPRVEPSEIAEPAFADLEETRIRVEKPLYVAEFTTRGGGLYRWELRGYHHGGRRTDTPIVITTEQEPTPTTLATPFAELGIGDLAEAVFEVEQNDDSVIGFRYERNGLTVRKIYTLDDDSYSMRLRVEVENGSRAPIEPAFVVLWPAAKRDDQEFKEEGFVAFHEGKVEKLPVRSLGQSGFLGSLLGRGEYVDPEYVGELDWVGIQTTYFLGVLLPDDRNFAQARIHALAKGEAGVAELSFPAVKLQAGQVAEQEFRAYLGPKEVDRLEAMGRDTVRSIDLGYSWIKPLVLGFGWLLRALYSIVPNYGVAIILLTIMVRVVTMPLTNRQMRSMERMRNLQPKVKELQEKHSDDRQKQSEEMMKLYRTEGVNPLGGCFPMLLQLPVFIGLFYALRSSIELRQAPFVGWINDLSAPETLFVVPGLEIPIRVLPIVMGASMVLQQKLTPTASVDPAQARMMMTIMPIMMTVLFYQFASGLVLYWFVSNILAIAHQLLIGRRIRAGG